MTNLNDNQPGSRSRTARAFRSDQAGVITGSVLQGVGDTGPTSHGCDQHRDNHFASKPFSSEPVRAGSKSRSSAPFRSRRTTTYVAAVFSSAVFYVADNDYFTVRTTTATSWSQDGAEANGVYHYGGDASDEKFDGNLIDVVSRRTGPTPQRSHPVPAREQRTSRPRTSRRALLRGSIRHRQCIDRLAPGSANNVVPANVSYDGNNEAATLTPTRDSTRTRLHGAHQARVGVKDSAACAHGRRDLEFQNRTATTRQRPGGPILVVASSTIRSAGYLRRDLGAKASRVPRTDITASPPNTELVCVVVLGR